MFGKLPIAGKKVCCLISGGNIDVNILSRVITRGLQREGRNCLLTIALADKPGQLLGVTQVISECGANIVGVTHERSDAAYAVTSCLLRISMETRDFAQIEESKVNGTRVQTGGIILFPDEKAQADGAGESGNSIRRIKKPAFDRRHSCRSAGFVVQKSY